MKRPTRFAVQVAMEIVVVLLLGTIAGILVALGLK
jgi:hypothetical protein